MNDPFLQQIETLAVAHGRPLPVFLWILQVLEHTRTQLGREGHVSARELLDGLRELAVREFGPMAFDVLGHWGLHKSADVGEVVFAMVGAGLLGKTDEDDPGDFSNGYDFHDAFVENYPW